MNLNRYKLPRSVMFKLMSMIDNNEITVVSVPKLNNSDLIERYRFVVDYIHYKNIVQPAN